MTTTINEKTDSKTPLMNQYISIILRGGVYCSCSFIIIGLFGVLIDPSHITSVNPTPVMFCNLLITSPFLGLILIGIVILMLTPIIRILLAFILFSKFHDWQYALISGVVFTVIAISLLIGIVF